MSSTLRSGPAFSYLLRSDTVIQPTASQREAMQAAELGFAAALFVPTGAMSNLLGLGGLGFAVESVQTNRVYVDAGAQTGELQAFCGVRGITLSAVSRMRLVAHLDVSAVAIGQVLSAFADFRQH